jgi:hypothetical protein
MRLPISAQETRMKAQWMVLSGSISKRSDKRMQTLLLELALQSDFDLQAQRTVVLTLFCCVSYHISNGCETATEM